MTMKRIIKKYPNRRLYDTESSCYITLDEIRLLVVQHIPFQVVDSRTKEDVTNHVLLQIIHEQESTTQPFFTTILLENIIRFYGNPLQNAMRDFFEKGLSYFNENQDDYQNVFQKMMESNVALWQSFLNKK
ncbi:MAG: polyhydroxyalkanoate synthesis repressor PhaR [Gammaproteobacteria bacterium]|nr:polyhydroxyalkanoate synthesis repressor PhaR [Gammaproteobacteria bacterium]